MFTKTMYGVVAEMVDGEERPVIVEVENVGVYETYNRYYFDISWSPEDIPWLTDSKATAEEVAAGQGFRGDFMTHPSIGTIDRYKLRVVTVKFEG